MIRPERMAVKELRKLISDIKTNQNHESLEGLITLVYTRFQQLITELDRLNEQEVNTDQKLNENQNRHA